MFYSAYYTYDGIPWTADKAKAWNPIGLPSWFSRASLHRAICAQVGPYVDPDGRFTVEDGQILVFFEVKQPPTGTEQAEQGLRPVIYAIFPINRTFVTPGSLLHKTVDPNWYFAPGDQVAIWFGSVTPPEVIGLYRPVDNDNDTRDNSGALHLF